MMDLTLARAAQVFLILYGTAILTSMAAMEMISWAWVAVMVGVGIVEVGKGATVGQVLRGLKVGPDLWLWLFWLAVAASLWFSPIGLGEWARLGDFRWIVVLYAVAWGFRALPIGVIERSLKVVFAVAGLVGLYSLTQMIWGIELFRSRQTVWPVGDVFRAPGLFNLSLTFAYVIGIVGFIASGPLWRLPVREWFGPNWRWHTLGAFAGALGCLASLTRGAWLAMVMTCIVVLLLVARRRLLGLFAVLVAVVGLAVSVSPGIRGRARTIVDPEFLSNYHRVMIWQANWQLVKEHPLTGVGLGLNAQLAPDAYERYHGFSPEQAEQHYHEKKIPRGELKKHAHNNFLHMLVGMGVFGLLFFITVSGWFLRAAWQGWLTATSRGDAAVAALALGLFAAQIYLHLGGLTECNFTDGEVTHALMFCWGLVVAVRRTPPAI